MRRLAVSCVFSILFMDVVVGTASELCLPPSPCQACIDSCDFGYTVGDCVTIATHWRACEGTQTLTGFVKVPQVKTATSTTLHRRPVKARVFAPTTVTRSFASRSYALEPRSVPVEVAFAQRKCCVDACGRCYLCIREGPHILVNEPDFHTRRVTRIVEQSADTVECKEVNRDRELKRVTAECEIEDTDMNVSTTGRRLSWKPDPSSIATGRVTLTRTRVVHVVPVTYMVAPLCPLPCRACKYTPCDAPSIGGPTKPLPSQISTPHPTSDQPPPISINPLPLPEEVHAATDENTPESSRASPSEPPK
jgi:hypothetical protein